MKARLPAPNAACSWFPTALATSAKTAAALRAAAEALAHLIRHRPHGSHEMSTPSSRPAMEVGLPPEKPRTRGFLHIVRHGSGNGTMYVVTYHPLDRTSNALCQLPSPMLAEGSILHRLARAPGRRLPPQRSPRRPGRHPSPGLRQYPRPLVHRRTTRPKRPNRQLTRSAVRNLQQGHGHAVPSCVRFRSASSTPFRLVRTCYRETAFSNAAPQCAGILAGSSPALLLGAAPSGFRVRVFVSLQAARSVAHLMYGRSAAVPHPGKISTQSVSTSKNSLFGS